MKHGVYHTPMERYPICEKSAVKQQVKPNQTARYLRRLFD